MTSAKLCTGSDDLPSWKLINQRVLMNEMLDEGMDLESGSEVDDEEEDLSDETPPLPQQRHSACRSPPYRPFCRPCPVTKDIDGTDIPPHALGTSSWMGEKDDSSIKALEATIAELQRKLDERGKLLRASEELRAALTKENHRLKVANAQMRYMSTPAPFEEQYLVKARGTPPNPNRRKKAAAAYLPVRTSSRVAKRALEVDNLEAKPRKKLARTNTAPSSLSGNYFPTSQPNGGPISSSSSTASTLRDISSVRLDSGTSSHKQYKTVGGSSEHSHAQRDLIGSMWSLGDSEAAPSSVLTRARSYESMEYADGQGQEEELSPKAKGKQRARESTKLDGQLQTGLETPDGGSVVYFASESDLGLGQKNNQGRKILPVTVHPRDPAHAHLPWFDDPTIPLLPRIPENLHGDFEGLESSKMIDSVLATTFGKPGAAAKCNASLVLVLKKFMEEAGVPMASFRWAILARILFENRLRWVGWPVEINHNPKPHDRPAGIPGSLRAGEMHLLKRVLARRFPPYVKSGLRLVKWDVDEMEKDFPPLFITTDGGRHSLRETMKQFIADDKTLLLTRGAILQELQASVPTSAGQPRVWPAPPPLVLPLSSHVLSAAT